MTHSRRTTTLALAFALALISRASAQTVYELTGHAGPVSTVAFTPDGARLLSAGFDKEVKLWDVASRAQVRSFTGHTDMILAGAMAPGGKQFATGGRDKTIKIWNFTAGDPRLISPALPADIAAVLLTPDGKQVTALGQDGMIRRFDTASGQATGEWKGHEGGVIAGAYSADGALLFTIGADAALRAWNANGEPVGALTGIGTELTHLTTSADGSRAISADRSGGLRAWRLPIGTLRALAGHQANIEKLRKAGDRVVSLGSDQTIHVHEIAGGSEVLSIAHPAPVRDLAVSPADANVLITSGADRVIRAWNLADGSMIAERADLPQPAGAVAMVPTGDKIVFGDDSGAVRAIPYPLVREFDERPVDAHLAPLTTLARSAKSGLVLTASQDRTVRLWDAAGQPIRAFALFAPVRQAALAESEDFVAAVGTDNVARLWNINGAEVRVLPNVVGPVALSPDGKLLAMAGPENKLLLQPTDFSAEPRVVATHAGPIRAVAFSPSGTQIYSAGDDANIKVSDVASGAEVRALAGHAGPVNSLAVATNGAVLVSGGEDKSVRVWKLETGEALATYAEATAPIFSVAILAVNAEDPLDVAVAAGSADQQVRLYRHQKLIATILSPSPAAVVFINDPQHLAVAQGDNRWRFLTEREPVFFGQHAGPVRSVAVSVDGQTTLSASDDRLVRVWETATGKSLRAFAHAEPVTQLALTGDGQHVVSAEAGGKVRTWRWNDGEPAGLLAMPGPVGSIDSAAGSAEFLVVDSAGTIHQCRPDGSIVDSLPSGNVTAALAFDAAGTQILAGKEKRLDVRPPRIAWSAAMTGSIVGLGATPEGQVVAVGADGAAALRSAADGQVTATHTLPASVAATLDPSGAKLLHAGTDQRLRVYELASGKAVFEGEPLAAPIANVRWNTGSAALLATLVDGTVMSKPLDGSGPTSYAASAKSALGLGDSGTIVAAGSDRVLRWFDPPPPTSTELTGQEGQIFGLAYSPDGAKLASAGNDRSAMIWDLADKKATATLRGHAAQVYSAAFSPSQPWLATAGGDKTVILWNLADGAELRRFAGAEDAVYQVVFLGSGERIAAVGMDRKVRIWETATGTPQPVLEGPSDELYGLACRPDGKRLATSGFGGNVTVWNVEAGQVLFTHKLPAPAYAVAYRSDGAQLAVAGADHKVYLIDLPPEAR